MILTAVTAAAITEAVKAVAATVAIVEAMTVAAIAIVDAMAVRAATVLNVVGKTAGASHDHSSRSQNGKSWQKGVRMHGMHMHKMKCSDFKAAV
jgi:hypothetical protein